MLIWALKKEANLVHNETISDRQEVAFLISVIH